LLYLTFLSVPRGSHWYLKAGPIPSPSTLFKIQQFLWRSFPCVRYMCSNVTAIWHSAQHLQVIPTCMLRPNETQPVSRSFRVSVTFPL
jgi:hypothetical protein